MYSFAEKYLIELILLAGCLLSHPLAGYIVSFNSYDDDTERAKDQRAVQLIFTALFGSLMVLSLFLSA